MEAFSLLKYWRGDDGPFFDLELDVPNEEGDADGTNENQSVEQEVTCENESEEDEDKFDGGDEDVLQGKVAFVTGGDSGTGRAICHAFALENAIVAFMYMKGYEDKDAMDTL
ncbi:Glucose and ribitol dehydrogenase [Morella rubra]|uniref:Glucose and ribitol dehydrogenase n=1 Tax=Morella rubra TaxID=262757 RepID=A0A6A1W8C1_9ROSI|nr:Glucose and ribitol dehydrogenase [Morella rubra]